MGTRQRRVFTHFRVCWYDLCLDCPFYSRGNEPVCSLEMEMSLREGANWHNPCPKWCPLKAGPVLVEVILDD
jgi:hypothetical protein